jgi:serine/threonine-protein kinase HipA
VSELLILIEGRLAARIGADRSGRLSLTYEPAWLTSEQPFPLSVSMPLAALTYPHKLISPFLWNLLPENPNVLQRWAQQYHVSAANPFKLLTYVGADVPGAAQFIPPEQVDAIESEHAPRIDWISIADLQERLRQLREDISAVRRPGDIGKLSLPGAQAKTAFYWDVTQNRWGVPGGRTPTTHIIKPCIPGFDGLVENEHLCQDIAARLGLLAARSSVLTLDDTYIVVERYDRLPPSAESPIPQRIHQEDLCQALSLLPARKYQEEGGPGIAQIVSLLRRVSTAPEIDVERFLRANIYNWLIGGTDAHAKNYSLLIGTADEVRLAPLYDLSSQLPYPELISQKVSMKIGDHYEIRRVGLEDWRRVAQTCALEEERVIGWVANMAKALPDETTTARDQALRDGLSRSVIVPLAQRLIAHAQERLASLAPVTSRSPRLRKKR